MPAMAASATDCPAQSFYAESENTWSDDSSTSYSESDFLYSVSNQYGGFQIQHWVDSNIRKMQWRIVLGVRQDVAAGSIIYMPIDPTWINPSVGGQFGFDRYNAFYPTEAGAYQPNYTINLPAATVAIGSDGITFTFESAISAGSAGGWTITTDPAEGMTLDGEDASTFHAEATYRYTPMECGTLS